MLIALALAVILSGTVASLITLTIYRELGIVAALAVGAGTVTGGALLVSMLALQ